MRSQPPISSTLVSQPAQPAQPSPPMNRLPLELKTRAPTERLDKEDVRYVRAAPSFSPRCGPSAPTTAVPPAASAGVAVTCPACTRPYCSAGVFKIRGAPPPHAACGVRRAA